MGSSVENFYKLYGVFSTVITITMLVVWIVAGVLVRTMRIRIAVFIGLALTALAFAVSLLTGVIVRGSENLGAMIGLWIVRLVLDVAGIIVLLIAVVMSDHATQAAESKSNVLVAHQPPGQQPPAQSWAPGTPGQPSAPGQPGTQPQNPWT